jgi:hypothetical protein
MQYLPVICHVESVAPTETLITEIHCRRSAKLRLP